MPSGVVNYDQDVVVGSSAHTTLTHTILSYTHTHTMHTPYCPTHHASLGAKISGSVNSSRHSYRDMLSLSASTHNQQTMKHAGTDVDDSVRILSMILNIPTNSKMVFCRAVKKKLGF